MSMNKKENISHKGKIIEITPEYTTVEILQTSACAGCHAKALCGLSEESRKVIMLPTDPYSDKKVGDEVDVELKYSMGLKAVWISYVIPLLILLILILSLSPVIVHELYRGLAAIAGVALYYFIIWLLRGKLANEVVFRIK